MFTFLKRAWIPLVVVVAVALGGVAVSRLRGVSAPRRSFTATGSSAKPLEPSHVTLSCWSPGGHWSAAALPLSSIQSGWPEACTIPLW